jgi:acyl carrier protein
MADIAEIRNRLNTVFQDVFDDPEIQIRDNMTAEDIEDWDSVAHITLVLSVEKEFGLRLNISEIGKLHNVGAMIELLTRLLP